MDPQISKLLEKTYILAIALVAGILIFLAAQMGYQARLLDQQNQNQVTVTGQGKVYAKPDVAMVSFGVKTEGSTVAEVAKKNSEQMNAVIDAIKALKVEAKDIQTTSYNLTPVYDTKVVPLPSEIPTGMPAVYSSAIPVKSSQILKGYSLEQNVEVKIRDFSKIGEVMAKATEKGANIANNLQFTIDNPESFKQEARAKAIEQAKESAKNLAKNSGIKLGKIINVYESYNPYPVSYKGMGMGGAADVAVPAPTIEPGQQEISISVNVTYKVQ